MPYKIRNSIVLAVILLIVIVGSTISNSSSGKKLKEENKKNEELTRRLTTLKSQMQRVEGEERLAKEVRELESQISQFKKVIVKEDNSTITYDYLMQICKKFCPNMIFDFKPDKSGEIQETKYNDYLITGKVPFSSLYAFIYQIENQPRLYTIESLEIREQPAGEKEILFALTLRSFYDQNGIAPEDIPIKKISTEKIKFNPFYPRIHEPVRIEEEEKYLNTEEAILVGLTPSIAFFKDKDGITLNLSVGDKVAYGYLSKINWEEQSVTFRINRIGIYTEKTVYLEGKG
jgi:Tfp pilus assembly protein PilO